MLGRRSWAGLDGLELGPSRPFTFEGLTETARRMARDAYRPPLRPVPALVDRIDYDEHGASQFRRDHALFADGSGAFPVTFFPLGKFFPKRIEMHLVRDGDAREIRYSPAYFDIPAGNPTGQLPDDAGFAGFRVHECRCRGDWRTQDWVAFLGASYFRAIGALGQYGLSARGIAIDTAQPQGEEFPDFRAFYIEEQTDENAPVKIHALLDGPSVTAAYRFALHRTAGVVMEVETHIFLRRAVELLGIAPLTSMYWYGERDRPYQVDWRPEVHDSDGLALWTGSGERIWRPLNNPDSIHVSSFFDHNPRGFGLAQRDRDFENYLDGVHYERRPSVWVEPLEHWGKGSVRLVELPTTDEIHDNIVCFWVAEERPSEGAAFRYRYRLHWLADHPYAPERSARAVASYSGRGGMAAQGGPDAGAVKYVVEFEGPSLDELGPGQEPEARVSASRGQIARPVVERVPGTGRWRALFEISAVGGDPVDLRLYLALDGTPLTETWLYQHLPELMLRS
jgi:periplasmic glucans biosynthesis protein